MLQLLCCIVINATVNRVPEFVFDVRHEFSLLALLPIFLDADTPAASTCCREPNIDLNNLGEKSLD